jgi:tetratricopeptide (TPR) repeat protein
MIRFRKFWSGFVPFALLVVAFSGCATGGRTTGPPRIERAGTGEFVVRVGSAVSFDEIAETVYNEPSLGPAVAELSHLPYAEAVPAGSVLVLPPAGELAARRTVARDVEDLFRRGLETADAGSFAKAADLFREALNKSPGRVDIQYNYGLALLNGDQLNEATRVLKSVASQRPDDAASRYAYGSVLRKWKEHERALREFEAALNADPRHASAAFARARTLEDLKNSSGALDAWKRFVRDFPNHPRRADAQAAVARLEQAR